MIDIKNEKNKIRRNIRDLREKADAIFVQSASHIITGKLIRLPAFMESNLIMCYISFKNEVLTYEFIEQCFSSGKRVALPVIDTDCSGIKGITAYEIFDVHNDLVPGFYGIFEPRKRPRNIIIPSEIDMIVVPGIAFDKKKQRIGFGAGYYDRFLSKLSNDCVKISIGFDFQIVENIPHEEHDIELDLIVTEKRIF